MPGSGNTDVAAHIRELILTGAAEPDRFLRLEPLATTIGVSVTPVREALMQLRAAGFVELHPRRGFRVLPLSADDIRDVYLAQAFIAGELAARATRSLSAKDVDALERIQEQLEQAHAAADSVAVEAHNFAFHRKINRAAEAPRLASLLRPSVEYAPRLFFANIPGWSSASATDHRAIIEAFRAGSSQAARDSMAQHIQHAGDLLAQHREARVAGSRRGEHG